jgi:hypothetical protein
MGWATIFSGICRGGPMDGESLSRTDQKYSFYAGQMQAPCVILGEYEYMNDYWQWRKYHGHSKNQTKLS